MTEPKEWESRKSLRDTALSEVLKSVGNDSISKNELKRRVKQELAMKKIKRIKPDDELPKPEPAEPNKARVLYIGDEPIPGKEKYLGGVLGPDGCAYGVPGHAETILKIDPKTDKVTQFGGPFKGHYKWLRGNCIVNEEQKIYSVYFMPSHSDKILKLIFEGTDSNKDPTIKLLDGSDDETRKTLREVIWKWHGGVTDITGRYIYGIPCNAHSVLKIDTFTDEVTSFGSEYLLSHIHPDAQKNKWYGGILDPVCGRIYGSPQNADSVLEIIPGHTPEMPDQVRVLGKDIPYLKTPGGWKWHGGMYCPKDGCIYGIPNHADTVIRICPPPKGCDVNTSAVVTLLDCPEIPMAHRGDGKYKYLGSVLGADGNLYCVPGDADRTLVINPVNKSETAMHLVGPNYSHLGKCQNKWQNGYCGRDGQVYTIPLKGESILQIDSRPQSNSNTSFDATQTLLMPTNGTMVGNNKWESGVITDDGSAIYCMPLVCKRVLKIEIPESS